MLKDNKSVPDKYTAVWVSHSSISDFLKCPRAYYLRNIYKDPKSGHKVTVVTPPLALGAAVHEVIESLATLPVEERFKISLVKKLDPVWLKYSGKKGGFANYTEELGFRERAIKMLINLQEDPGPIMEKAVKIKTGSLNLPNYYISEKDNIILCGKIDWLKYEEKDDSVHIIDFKTGKREESEDSLQLPIYLLLATNTQSRKVSGASYWYLDRDDGLIEKKLPEIKESYKKVLTIAKKIKEARAKNEFVCPKGGCYNCRPLERVLTGEAEFVGTSETRQDIYRLISN
ncbi:MAG TPA: PD-(D/E)XK nuclease family protein [Patescibacteria group bacterium]|nr:PD-(D/E)XK nuclease family protein [Patescibacteria group bacterium]